jgi:Ca-activated chloride channel family protein
MTSSPTHSTRRRLLHALIIPALLAASAGAGVQAQDGFRFKSGVDLVNVTATVTDEYGRFVPSLTKDDFSIFENGRRQEISHFSNERTPVSLGILLDASGSMTADKMAAARSAIDRFIYELLGREDELFFVEFASTARVTQAWTTDRAAISHAVSRVDPVGGTAIYDAIAKALPMAAAGRHKKKALLVISDGNDTSSSISVPLLRQQIRDSEVLVYALGVDGAVRTESGRRQPPIIGVPTPNPFPPSRPRGRGPIQFPPIIGGGGGSSGTWTRNTGERVNPDALREVTDDTGGRTEIVRGFGDLQAATARLADELSKQYSLAYSSTEERDGRWHPIRVEVRDRRHTVRARRGYTAAS